MSHCNVMALATQPEALLSTRRKTAGINEVLVLMVAVMCSSRSEICLKY